jgi:hypothetical protein
MVDLRQNQLCDVTEPNPIYSMRRFWKFIRFRHGKTLQNRKNMLQ